MLRNENNAQESGDPDSYKPGHKGVTDDSDSESKFTMADERLPPYTGENLNNYSVNNSDDTAPVDIKDALKKPSAISAVSRALNHNRPTLYVNIALFLVSLTFLITCLVITIPVRAGQSELSSSYKQTQSYVEDILVKKTAEIENQKHIILSKDNELVDVRRQISQLHSFLQSKDNEIGNLLRQLGQNGGNSGPWIFSGSNMAVPSYYVLFISLCLTILLMKF